MNFPENPVLAALYWLINTPGLGGIAVALLGASIFLSVGLTLRWIVVLGGQADEAKEYAYPTPALHHSDEEAEDPPTKKRQVFGSRRR